MKKYFKMIALVVVLVAIFSQISLCSISANAQKTGTYSKKWEVNDPLYDEDEYGYLTYWVTINKIKNKKIKFQVGYVGKYGSPIYITNVINAKLKGKTANFKWKDTWDNKGKGTIKLYKNYVKIKMIETKTAPYNRFTLSANYKLKRTSNKTKFSRV